jgi:hypothetical protein
VQGAARAALLQVSHAAAEVQVAQQRLSAPAPLLATAQLRHVVRLQRAEHLLLLL